MARRTHKARRPPASLKLVWLETPPSRHGRRDEDPLGLRHLEDRIADWFWPGFSRRTTRAGYFVMTLYGLRAAEEAAEAYGLPRDDDTRRFLFGRFERLWAMSQVVTAKGSVRPEDEILGLEAMVRTYFNQPRELPIDFLHLQQGEVGALGAYLASLRTHRLISDRRLRLTPLGLELAQWMWDDPRVDRSSLHDFVIKALNPRNTRLPARIGRVGLAELGERGKLLRIESSAELREMLWRRLIQDRPPPAALDALPHMAAHLTECHAHGITEPTQILQALIERRSRDRAVDLKRPARIALCLADLGTAMLRILDRTYAAILAEGYSAAWSDCVSAAATPELVEDLNEQMARYRRLDCNELIEGLSAHGRAFGQTMRRFSTSNPYNTFESILNLHVASQNALGRGDGWIARTGEVVFLKQAATSYLGTAAGQWQPEFRMSTMLRFLDSLGRLS